MLQHCTNLNFLQTIPHATWLPLNINGNIKYDAPGINLFKYDAPINKTVSPIKVVYTVFLLGHQNKKTFFSHKHL